MAEDGVRAGEAELRLDIPDARPVGVLGHVPLHVIKDGLLLLGECFHGERMFDESLFTVKNGLFGLKLRF
jgi:hypothetical protein